MQKIKSTKIEGVISEIIDQYAYADQTDRPWIIGFSGGKDSTVLLTLVWIALQRIRNDQPYPFQLRRPVYVVCNDTMVENPIIASYVDDVLAQIDTEAREQNLPIYVKKTTPKLEESFWVNVLGRGYPVPNNKFRWCTDKMKIKPTSYFLTEQIDEKGEAIILLGTRYEESSSRETSMRKHEISNSRLSLHANEPNAYVFAPLKELLLEEVWYIINAIKSPWGADNSVLFKIYADASADDYECPTVVTNESHKSCGQSRFGCWTCTVVKQDKSMSGLIENGQDWLQPLLKFRNELVAERNLSENRMETRRNGQRAVDEDGHRKGTYQPHYRAKKLKELLLVQKEIQKERPHLKLITNQELIAIQIVWSRDMIFDYNVGQIYRDIFQKEISTENLNGLDGTERRILKDICAEDASYYELIDNLLDLQQTKSLLLSKYGLHNDIERRIESFVTDHKL
ncbi:MULTISPECIES: DNA phosphorothioation system sulfurtransferase DndC [Leeuwenhoekiella]|uniref:DNA phosphorothioation system sulfurtransferase DndC n=1 Tax=Leeuwenhoekiella TaxID=283735 RepID=UPI0023544619|nr:DNA phosphorothioation system sulfurtransferase DndC [Leeuwenhoekiella blandensis]|tara:strand:- start:706 stop:2070 length:1365 start_codon:yes stop_codon:yes gene_type:complete